jgi:MFS family permease
MRSDRAGTVLAVVGAAAFLSGLELMITAVALPAIIVDLADWTQLRAASWIVNGYLLVSIVVMPLAGRLADRVGVRRVFLWGLVVFVLGSALAGRATALGDLVAARLVQALGGAALVPAATAAASHRFAGAARSRALGFVGAQTFLGMAAGPFAGAWVMQSIHPGAALAAAGVTGTWLEALADPWRYVFYLNVPIGLVTLAIAWAGWPGESRRGRGDAPHDVPFDRPGDAPAVARRLGPRGESRRWSVHAALRSRPFVAALIVSLLTGYAFATAIIGGAVFVDRVLYGGPDVQRVALGSLAAATAVGALGAGLVLRIVGLRITTLTGLAAAATALVSMSGWTRATPIAEVAGWMALFGLGFGLTVTPPAQAAVEALGERRYGVASAAVTMARLVGMAVGLGALAAFGSDVIDRLYAEVRATPDAYKLFIPESLRDRGLNDGLVVQALEEWASGEAARILVGVFLVAAAVLVVAAAPALGLGRACHPPPGGLDRSSLVDAAADPGMGLGVR